MLFVTLIVSFASVSAATNEQNGIGISPALQQLNVLPGDSGRTFTITVFNHTKSAKIIALSTKDFGSLNDTGGVLLKNDPSYAKRFGLASWLQLEKTRFTLLPGASEAVQARVENRTDLQPGGHYGAVIATVDGKDTATGNIVNVHQELLSLVLVTKTGGEHYDLALKSLSHNGNWLHLPDDIRLHFQNPGNVHVVPRGTVRLERFGGKVISTGIINTESAFILPGSSRDIYVPMQKVGRQQTPPGDYRIVVEYRYEGIQKTARHTVKFRYLDLKLFAAILFVLMALTWTITRLARRAS